MKINSSINPATLSYLQRGFARAHVKDTDLDLIVVKMNTPGGLVSVTKDILTLFGESKVPVAVWITPSGASATSAGAIIASGAHLVYMADGTNIGAATPVQLGKNIEQKDVKAKAINDLVALVQSLSDTHKRNEKLFGKMIKDAASYKAKDAKKKKLINGIVNIDEDLFHALHKSNVTILGKKYTLEVLSPIIIHQGMSLGEKLLNIFANPSLAYILFLIGAALMYLELQAPGGFIAGSVGAFALLLAGIGFHILPLNFGALGLIILSFILFVLEAYITSYGIISLAGLASLITGSLFLFKTDNAYIELSSALIYSASAGVGLFLLLIFAFLIKDIRGKRRKKFNSHVGKEGTISEIINRKDDGTYVYSVKISGEIWKAESVTEFKIGDQCKITEQNNDTMFLII